MIVVNTPGLKGSDIDPATTGWAWNEGGDWGGMLFAAGSDE